MLFRNIAGKMCKQKMANENILNVKAVGYSKGIIWWVFMVMSYTKITIWNSYHLNFGVECELSPRQQGLSCSVHICMPFNCRNVLIHSETGANNMLSSLIKTHSGRCSFPVIVFAMKMNFHIRTIIEFSEEFGFQSVTSMYDDFLRQLC